MTWAFAGGIGPILGGIFTEKVSRDDSSLVELHTNNHRRPGDGVSISTVKELPTSNLNSADIYI